MKLRIFIYPGGPSLSEIKNKLETFTHPLSDPIQKQATIFAEQIFDRVQNMDAISDPTHFTQNQTISDNNHTILLRGRMTPPSFWKTILGKVLG